MTKKQLLNTGVYFILATFISLVFRMYTVHWLDFFRLPYGNYYGMSLLVGVGPIVAALLSKYIFKNRGAFLSFWGNSPRKSALFLLLPIVTVGYLLLSNEELQLTYGYTVQLIGMWLLYIVGEEFGWRSYLQEVVLKGVNDYQRALLIGIVWYLWHLSFIYIHYSPIKELVFIAVLLVGSFIALKVVQRTQSFATAIALHFSFSVLTNIPLPSHATSIIIAMCAAWLLLYVFWNRGVLKKF